VTRVRGLIVGISLIVLGLAAAPARAEEGPFKGLDEYVAKTMKDWDVPGLAIAVIKDDTVVLAKGYGVRKLGEDTPVDEKTLFAVGSTTKAFTAAALAMLVDEGKIKWDDKVTQHLPKFQMYDPYVTREMTIRDLLCHRSGLDRTEAVWYGSAASRDEIIRRLRFIKPASSFRSKFGYQNMMYMVAGQIIPAVTGKSWDDFVKERIFKPLGMTASNSSVTALSGADNVATPHHKIEDKMRPIKYRNIDNIGPAGSINSSVVDMAQWVRLHLNEGNREKGKDRLISSGAIQEMHTPQTVLPLDGMMAKLLPEAHLAAYGLGWMIQDYRGKKLLEHAGGIDGMVAQVSMIPEEKLGVVVLANSDGNQLPHALAYRILDGFLLKTPPRDWSADLLKIMKGVEAIAKAQEKKQEKERVKDTKPSLALDKYAGTYNGDIYGAVKVVKEKDKLVLHFGPAFVGDMEHWHYDTFRATWRDPIFPKALVTFTLNSQGKVAEVKFKGMDGSELKFKRAEDSPAITLSEAELKKFVGTYELKEPKLELSIEFVAGKLKAALAGQSLTLVPIKPTRFKVEEAPDRAFLQFEVADGKVKSMTLEQDGAPNLKFERKP
jgi:CubicO group peptidase (beta-lactamase class C family)